jgi:hypothetical protein
MQRTVSILGKALAAVLIAGAAVAAEAGPGNGIRLGGSEGVLHPFLDVESRYDSNVSYSENDAIADVILHVRPGMELKLPGDLAALEFSGALDWAQYLGMEGPTSNLSRMYGEATIGALLARRSSVSVRVNNEFRRSVSSTSLTAVSTAVVSNANTLTLSVPWTPGGGALVLAATGQWTLETFEKYLNEPAPVDVGSLGYSHFRGGAEVQWRFLPRTTAVFQAAYYSRVPNARDASYEASGFDVSTGLTGLLTHRISATVKAGYGSTSAPGLDSRTALADVSLEWLLMDSLSFRTGYNREFGVDPSASVYVSDGVSASARLKLAERFAVRGGVRWDRLTFAAVPGAETTYLRLDPAVEGIVGRWLQLAVGYVYSSRAATWPGAVAPDYSKNEAFLRVGLTY